MIGVMSDLAQAMLTVVDRCLAVKRDEEVLVLVDDATADMGESLRREARRVGADAVLTVMDERATDGSEPPPTVAGALAACDVFIAPTSRSLSHTSARKRATDGGARGATMPGADADMLARVMAVDFELMAARSWAVAKLLEEGKTARITCPRGSDARLDLSGRPAIADDGDLRTPGSFGNLPCGEGFIAPINGDGRVVVASLAPLGISDAPATLEIRGGRLVEALGGLGPEYLELLQTHGEAGTNLAELGVGTNDRARLSGKVLEDEKILGTVHVAFGASAGIGGAVAVPIHLDSVVLDASLEVDGKAVLDEGRFVLEATVPR
jgi:leucyl aminopeptidase (aminopeptidase T)